MRTNSKNQKLARRLGLFCRAGASGCSGLGSRRGHAGLFRGTGGGVLAGALGLQNRGVELAVAAIGALGHGLRVVLEGVGWWLGAFIVDAHRPASRGLRRMALKLIQDKGDET